MALVAQEVGESLLEDLSLGKSIILNEARCCSQESHEGEQRGEGSNSI